MKPRFFKTPETFRKWFENNHDSKDELWVGYYKKGSGKASITWPESVDEALCYGWIDGLRKSIDDVSYKIRFTPRRRKSHWSNVNLKRVQVLEEEGRMRESGRAAFQARDAANTAKASYEQGDVELPIDYLKLFRKNKTAWNDFQSRTPSYRKQCTSWIISAKREETRMRRLNTLIECCEKGEVIPPMKWMKKK